MGILKSLGDFLFGKDPDIFDENGNVCHRLEPRTWDEWDARLKASPEYDWRHHKGTELGSTPNTAANPAASNASETSK